MGPSWLSISEVGGLLLAVVGFGVAQGKLRQKVSDMGRQLGESVKRVTEVEAKVADNAGKFDVISVKLENILTNQNKMDGKMDKMDDRLTRHCEDSR